MKKLLAILVALLVMPMAFAAGNVHPGAAGTVPQTALISGSGSPPTIEYTWVLPDEDSLTSGTQLYPEESAERNDIYACVVVSDPQGRDDVQNVYVDVYHPAGTGDIIPCVEDDTGSNNPPQDGLCDESGQGQPWEKDGELFKYQVHAVKLDPVSDQSDIEACKLDALEAGLITQQDFDDINYYVFQQPEWYMYKVYLPMLYHQPAGTYETRSWATDTASAVSQDFLSSFDWVSTVALEIDFMGGVSYGTIQPSVYKVVQGDYDMGDSAQPSVKNEGNERLAISVSSTDLVGIAHGKIITDFDLKWDPEEEGATQPGYGTRYYNTGDVEELECTGYDETPLELCQTEKIDFSVHAAVGLPADTYTGIMTISTEAFVPGNCTI
jgi:hypothetical protein